MTLREAMTSAAVRAAAKYETRGTATVVAQAIIDRFVTRGNAAGLDTSIITDNEAAIRAVLVTVYGDAVEQERIRRASQAVDEDLG
jgi:hypothetical protein